MIFFSESQPKLHFTLKNEPNFLQNFIKLVLDSCRQCKSEITQLKTEVENISLSKAIGDKIWAAD